MLSGGQAQRLLIAGALIRKPRVLLLDEATNWLDNAGQASVVANIARVIATRIVIAHRLTTIRGADRVYVMSAGKVVQEGSYDELAAVSGQVRDLVARQTADAIGFDRQPMRRCPPDHPAAAGRWWMKPEEMLLGRTRNAGFTRARGLQQRRCARRTACRLHGGRAGLEREDAAIRRALASVLGVAAGAGASSPLPWRSPPLRTPAPPLRSPTWCDPCARTTSSVRSTRGAGPCCFGARPNASRR